MPKEKHGAGLLIWCRGEVLLLKRSMDSGNPGTWGLPGGNCDDSDAHLLETAVREAREEMGCLPPAMRFAHHADAAADAAAAGGTPLHVLTRRGKALQKQFTVFPAAIEPAAKAAYVPHLNPEHVEWAWVALEALPRRLAELHPVVAILVTQHGPALQEALHALSAAQCGDCMHA